MTNIIPEHPERVLTQAEREMLGALRLLVIQGHYPNHEYERLKAIVQPGTAHVDSEGWTCWGCRVEFIGRRPADDTCRQCTVDAVMLAPAEPVTFLPPVPVKKLPPGGENVTGECDSDPAAVEVVSASLTAIRGVLEYCLGSETADRQVALERIEQILNASRTTSGVEPGGSASLLPADVATVLSALDEAAEYVRDAIGACTEDHSAGCSTCDHHRARAGSYDALAAKLGGAR